MGIRFNHTVVRSRDHIESATFLADILGLPSPSAFGPLLVVQLENGASLDFMDAGDRDVVSQHYAFLIEDEDFDPIFGRIRGRGLDYWADPFKERPGEINHNRGGRGVYFDGPDGHFFEVLTRPYEGGGSSAGH